MKKSIFTIMILAALVLSLPGCGSVPAAETAAPAAEQQAEAEAQAPAEDTAQIETAEPDETAATSVRQDGERFESIIMLEGMEETVQYEHIRNELLGFEMDYDYELFARYSEADRERFLSVWDDPENPWDYFEVTYNPGSAELVADAISTALSSEYDILRESRELDGAGSCIYLEASVIKGTNLMADQLQMVYIIPASDGCRVAAAHFAIESAEGFGRRFSYMINTLAVLDRPAGAGLTDEQALAAIKNYCILSNPDLADLTSSEDYTTYWEIASSSEQEVVVLFRSYTGAQVRYYIDRVTGDTYVTEFVPGITPEEERTEESLNAWQYAG